MTPDSFEDLNDVLRIFATEVLESKRIGCKEVATELDPFFRFQWAIDLEDLVRSGLDVRSVLHRHVEIGVPPMEIFFFLEELDRAVEVPETIGR